MCRGCFLLSAEIMLMYGFSVGYTRCKMKMKKKKGAWYSVRALSRKKIRHKAGFF
jgi:hypothetical protein